VRSFSPSAESSALCTASLSFDSPFLSSSALSLVAYSLPGRAWNSSSEEAASPSFRSAAACVLSADPAFLGEPSITSTDVSKDSAASLRLSTGNGFSSFGSVSPVR
jgi:hypothetical protein